MKIIQRKNMFPNVSTARYNLAVWQQSLEGSLCFIGREVTQAGTIGQPDEGILKLFEVSNKGEIIQEKIIWAPIYEGFTLEDPRALKLPNDTLIIGLTAVLRNKKGEPVPFPAIVKIDSVNSWQQKLPPILIVDTFGPGKNITPVDNTTYLFRPDSMMYSHNIIVFSLHSQIPEKVCDIAFPKDLSWGKWKIGTTMSPIWITENEALLIIHGISIQVIDGIEKYIYNIGRAKMTRNGNIYDVIVAKDPILTPDDFLDDTGKPLVQELHPELRRVVYSCGGILDKNSKDTLSLFVNVGDRTTFEVEFAMNELKEGLFD